MRPESTPPGRTISDLTLEQYHLGELSAEQRRHVQEAVARDEVLRNRLSEIEKSDEEIRSRYPAERIVPLIHARMRGSRARWTAIRERFSRLCLRAIRCFRQRRRPPHP